MIYYFPNYSLTEMDSRVSNANKIILMTFCDASLLVNLSFYLCNAQLIRKRLNRLLQNACSEQYVSELRFRGKDSTLGIGVAA